jgi:hypothetical protein
MRGPIAWLRARRGLPGDAHRIRTPDYAGIAVVPVSPDIRSACSIADSGKSPHRGTTWGFSYDDTARRTPRLLQIRDSRGLIE